jgi:hypothetical protein
VGLCSGPGCKFVVGDTFGLPKKMVSLPVIALISAHYIRFRSIYGTIYEGHILVGFAMTECAQYM